MTQHANKSQKIALVTGASKGIGRALAAQLLEEKKIQQSEFTPLWHRILKTGYIGMQKRELN